MVYFLALLLVHLSPWMRLLVLWVVIVGMFFYLPFVNCYVALYLNLNQLCLTNLSVIARFAESIWFWFCWCCDLMGNWVVLLL